jgi:acetolactate synthase-1/2/3 large subunit
MKVSDYVAEYLSIQGVHQVFEVVGGMTTHLVDSLYRQGKIRLVSMHHEQAAAFAADAVGRVSGVPGVAMATSGPGATNLLTGIGSCYFDSSPAVFITGQVNRNEQKGNRPIRQLGFQETDIVSMATPITKAAWRVESPEQMPALLANAFAMALSGRPGPVLLDIPMDVQRADISGGMPSRVAASSEHVPDLSLVEELLAALGVAKRPLILAGGGVRAAGAREMFREFAHVTQVPVVNSLMAVDTLPSDNPLHIGMIGSYGNRWANLAIGRSDLLLVLGSRLDVRQTGSETKTFKEGRVIYHVDCETGEINNRVTGCHAIISDLQSFLEVVIELSTTRTFPQRTEWLAEINELRQTWPDTTELRDVTGINPNELMHQLSAVSRAAAAFVVDVGQHQMWAAQSLEVCADQRFLTSGGMGAMGFGLPAGIGVAFTFPDRPVVVIAGDGGFQLNIQEIETVIHHRLPIKMVILNNECHGMVRQFQESYFEERYPSTFWGYSAPDFTCVAEAYGISAFTARDPGEVQGGLEKMWQDPQTPFLLQVMVSPLANVYPKIAFGHPITEMEPFAKPLDMEGT